MSGPAPRLIAITDVARHGPVTMLDRLRALCAAARPGSVMVQLRDRQLSARARAEVGRELRAATRDAEQWFVVNDRLDLAIALDADGVHLGEASVSVAEARRVIGARFVSVAAHAVGAVVLRAGAPPADAVVLSPVLAPRKGAKALGIAALREARAELCRVAPRPLLVVLGGVDAEGAAACLAAGADAVAAIGAVLDAPDPGPLLRALKIVR